MLITDGMVDVPFIGDGVTGMSAVTGVPVSASKVGLADFILCNKLKVNFACPM
jgi:hypothetical protein